MKTIIIFGGGISGLTTAHYLNKTGKFIVYVIEKDHILGGMARSTYVNGVPSEHSWRGFAPFYYNFYSTMKQIPNLHDKNTTINDNFNNKPINFTLFTNKNQISTHINKSDYPYIFYLFCKFYLSDKRRKDYYNINIKKVLDNKISKHTHDVMIEYANGPGFGFDKSNTSYGHFFRVIELNYFLKTGWKLSDRPTDQAVFNPWKAYLEKQGVNIVLNRSLKKINYKDNKITSCELDNGDIIIADDYVIALSPYAFEKVLHESQLYDLEENYKKLNTTPNHQISFRIGFNKKINFPTEPIAFVLIDSKSNITFYPQETVFAKDIDLGKDIKSLWSGTCVNSHDLMNKTPDQVKREIIFEMFESQAFKDFLIKNNNNITEKDITHFEIFEDWYYDTKNKQLKSHNDKWVNNCLNENFRPEQTTMFDNLFITGAHTKTSLGVWSMEAANESGLITNNIIRKKYNLDQSFIYNHDPNYDTNKSKMPMQILRPIRQVDNILYKFKLPNIVDMILIIIIILIIVRILKKLNKNK